MNWLELGASRVFHKREIWEADRQNWMGASDCYAALGFSTFTSPYACWLMKTKGVNLDAGILAEYGQRSEEMNAKWFADKTGMKLAGLASSDKLPIWKWDDWDILASTPDEIVLDDDGKILGPLECKAVFAMNSRQWDTKLPLAYQIQLQVQMLTLGVDEGWFSALLHTGFSVEHRWYHQTLSAKFKDWFVPKVQEFWAGVKSGAAPPMDNSQHTSKLLSSAYVDVAGEQIILDDRFDALHEQKAAAAVRLAAAKKEVDTVNNEIKAALGENESGVLSGGAGVYSWRQSGKSRRLSFKKGEVV